MRLPADALLRHIEARGGLHALLIHGGVQNQSAEYDRLVAAVKRARRTGVLTAAAADQLSLRVLSAHPFEIYGETWWAA